MKAIGARTGAIGRYYLVMTVLVAAAATLIALAPAVWIGRTFLGSLLTTLGIQPVSLAAPWWVYAVILAAGLGLPPLMALPPLVKASRTTVRAAIDHHGAAARPGGRLVRLSRLPRLDRGLLMALRNTMRRPARFWLSTELLVAAGVVFVAGIVEERGGDNMYVTAEGLAAAQGRPQQVDRLRVFTGGHDERTRDAVAAAVRAALADTGIAVRRRPPSAASRPSAKGTWGRCCWSCWASPSPWACSASSAWPRR